MVLSEIIESGLTGILACTFPQRVRSRDIVILRRPSSRLNKLYVSGILPIRQEST